MAKPSNYMTRALRSNDPRYARILRRLGYTDPTAAEEPPHPLDHDGDGQKGGSAAGEESTRARSATKAEMAAEYETLTGDSPDGRWNKDTLERELEQARGKYGRRDMRAED